MVTQLKRLSFFIALMLSLIFISCGGNSIDKKLDKIEKVVAKWEKKKKDGGNQKMNCEEMKNDIEKAGGQNDL
jgi:hypothetical protein